MTACITTVSFIREWEVLQMRMPYTRDGLVTMLVDGEVVAGNENIEPATMDVYIPAQDLCDS